MEQNTVERAIKTEIDTRSKNRIKKLKKKEWASSVGLCQRHKPREGEPAGTHNQQNAVPETDLLHT